jgi:DNA-binding beta-propeller fold protein YncE
VGGNALDDMGTAGAVKKACAPIRGLPQCCISIAAAAWCAIVALVTGCRSTAPERVSEHRIADDERLHAGDAGFLYQPGAARAGVPMPPVDAGVRPAILPFAGVPGGRGDLDGVGGEARIGLVTGMARVGDTLVFADEGNGSVRRFVPATGQVTTLVHLPRLASGTPSLPWGIASDRADRVYVTDRSAHVVYALDLATRALTVLAGQPGVRGDAGGDAAHATLDSPAGLAVAGGMLYVADTGNHRILRIDLARRSVVTLIAGFMQPWGLCADGDALFMAESLQEAVFRIDVRTGTSTLLAGSNRFGYAGATNGRGGIARFRTPRGIDCAGDALFVADRGNAQLRRLDRATSKVTSVAGSIANGVGYREGQSVYALFRDVQSAVRLGDTVYVGDDAALRAVSLPDGMVRTAAGAGERLAFDSNSIERGELLEPEGIAVSAADGAAFVAGGRAWSVHRIDLATGETTLFAGSPYGHGFFDAWGLDARFGAPSAITTDGRGTLFVGDPDNHAVRALRIATRQVSTVAGTPSVCGNDDGALPEATLCDPAGLASDGGVLFVADASTQTVRRIDLESGTVSTLAGEPFTRGYADGKGRAARFSSPAGLAFARGALFVADRENGVIRRVDVVTGEVTTVAPGRFDLPTALAPSGDDGLLVLDRQSVDRLSLPSGQVVRLFSAGPGLRAGSLDPSLGHPTGVAELSSGDALLVDRSESAVVRLAF